MMRESYKAKNGATQYRPVVSEAEYRGLQFDGNPGFCLACGLEVDGVEPDARRYRCEDCGALKVYGLEELLMMGVLRFGEVAA